MLTEEQILERNKLIGENGKQTRAKERRKSVRHLGLK